MVRVWGSLAMVCCSFVPLPCPGIRDGLGAFVEWALGVNGRNLMERGLNI